jgi:hypothetical protein
MGTWVNGYGSYHPVPVPAPPHGYQFFSFMYPWVLFCNIPALLLGIYPLPSLGGEDLILTLGCRRRLTIPKKTQKKLKQGAGTLPPARGQDLPYLQGPRGHQRQADR